MLKRGLRAIPGTDTDKTLEDRGFNAAVLMSDGFDQIYNLLSGVPGLGRRWTYQLQRTDLVNW